MNQLIIIAHPKNDSLNYTIKNELEKSFINQRDQVKIRDLYKMNFNPVLNNGELKYVKEGNICPEVFVEQNYIAWAENITIIYPLWWNSFPAILKGYIDRVFINKFAFKITNQGPKGLLKRKKLRLITTAGMTEESLKKSHTYESLKVTQDIGVFEFCGLEVVDHLYITESSSLSENEKSKIVDRIIKKANENQKLMVN